MSPYVHAQYCDDIRYEENFKTTLVGIYGPRLVTPTIPLVMPKLCVVITISIPIDALPDKCLVVLLYDDEKLFEANINIKEEAGAQPSVGDTKDQAFTFSPHLTFSPFEIKRVGRLKLRVYLDGEEFRGPALLLEQGEVPQPGRAAPKAAP